MKADLKLFRVYMFILPLCFISCSRNMFLQRKYTSGIFTEHTDNNSKPRLGHLIKKAEDIISVKRKSSQENRHSESLYDKKPDCSDTLVLRSLAKITCKVSCISDSEVHFQNCAIEAPTRSLSLHEIHYIRFKNGVTEKYNDKYLQSEPSRNPSYVAASEKPIGFALFGYIFTMLGGGIMLFAFPPAGFFIIILGVIGAVILTAKPRMEIRQSQRVARGLGIGLGVIGVTSFALLILAIMALTAFI